MVSRDLTIKTFLKLVKFITKIDFVVRKIALFSEIQSFISTSERSRQIVGK